MSILYIGKFKTLQHVLTRKLCCRKDDRAMRPVYRCRENLRGSLTTVS